MRTKLLTGALLLAIVQTAAAWAILLKAPQLQYPANATQKAITAAEAEMKRLKFDSGIIHVSAPQPTRNLRFKAPGQQIATLVPLLEQLGFKIEFSASENAAQKWLGFSINQPEDGKNIIHVVANSLHPKFDATKFDAAKLAKKPPA